MKNCHICENYPHPSDTCACLNCQTIFCSLCTSRYFPNENPSSNSLIPKEGKSGCAVCDKKCKCRKCHYSLIAIDLFPLPFSQPLVPQGTSKKQGMQGFMQRMAIRRKMLYEKGVSTEPQNQEGMDSIQSQIEGKCKQQNEEGQMEVQDDRAPKGAELENMIMECQ